MKKNYLKPLLLTLIFFLSLIFFKIEPVLGESSEERLRRLGEEIAQYEKEIVKLSSQASTLQNQIAQYDAQIILTTLKIDQTQQKISLLGGRITQLEGSLQSLTKAFSSRAAETYKMVRFGQPIVFLISSQDLNQTVSRFHYLSKIQEADRDLLIRLQKAQDTYQEEKDDQEELQKQLEAQKANLDSQKKARANLLAATKNDERRYQQLIASARAEFEAIQAIIAGKGDETEAGKVSEGQRIASIIQGPSCNSSGTHLHFMIKQGGSTANPFSYLKPVGQYENCTGSSCGSSDGDAFNPSGSWNWPINEPIRFTQGYGVTWGVRNTWVSRIYSFHNGIDINSTSGSEVKAVRAGTLFRGSYSGSGCRLRYVRLAHDDSGLETLYLHINY